MDPIYEKFKFISGVHAPSYEFLNLDMYLLYICISNFYDFFIEDDFGKELSTR